jgi:phosphoglycolate phosphatase-like HAD superfamily hydrolase
MRDRPKVIALDFDGVICRPPLGLNLGISNGEWPAALRVSGRVERKQAFADLLTSVRYAGRRPLLDAQLGLSHLSEKRQIAIVTGRPARMIPDIRSWLTRYGLDDLISFIFANDTGFSIPRFKLEMAEKLNAHEFVEDDGRTARFLHRFGVANVFLREWPKNRGNYPEQIRVVRSLSEVASALTL